MIEIKNNKTEKAILIGLQTSDISRETAEEHIDELEFLAKTAGAETELKIIQAKHRRDSAYFIGKGKAEELAQYAETNDISLIIFDDDLTPVQVRNLERLFNKKIVDRSGLILDIFASRAKTNEAKKQVELAQLQYMLPRLTRAWTHLSKQYGGIGTKGPGETQIETDRRMIRTRISLLKEKLDKIESQRIIQSTGRKEEVRISLAGYTNAGKSTLFNILTEAEVLAENKLFATLDSTTRTCQLNKNHKILITDTVGFIRKLPPHLIASFKSTLNEVRDADIILHVVDVSHPYYQDHISVVEQTLKELGCEKKTQIIVFNKIDAINDNQTIEFLLNSYKNVILISALKGMNLQLLKDRIIDLIENSFINEKINIPYDNGGLVNFIHSNAEVLSTKYNNKSIRLHYKTDRESAEKIKKKLELIKIK